jgi:hypothetical protein
MSGHTKIVISQKQAKEKKNILSWNVTKFRLHDFGYLDIFWGFPVKCVLLFLISVKQLKIYILDFCY